MATYTLSTLADVYNTVPIDKILLCMKEIADGMLHAKRIEELMIASGDVSELQWPRQCQWLDDGKTNCSIRIHDGVNQEDSVLMEFKKA
jgi:hypothetical protein